MKLPKLPRIPVTGILTLLVALIAVGATYRLSVFALDRPIRAITIAAPFQRVTEVQIEEAISREARDGFLSADLDAMRRRIEALPWADSATVRRQWPDRLRVTVTEQVPAARWGDSGLLNVRGDLFLTDARHIPAELPRLSGPDGSAPQVATRYLAVRGPLIEAGLDLAAVELDARGAWCLTLTNGIEIRLGRREVDERLTLFLGTVVDMVAARESEISYVDMRYSNGFSIGWNEAAWAGMQSGSDDSRVVAAKGAG
jgi:cell division protein FtsQ